MGYREFVRMIDFLKRSKKVKKLFGKGTVEVRYDPILDEIHFISTIDGEVISCKV